MKKKLRIAGFEAGITKSEGLEIVLVALFVATVIKLVNAISIGVDGTEFVIVVLSFPIGMGIFKFFAKRKWLSWREFFAGLFRVGLLLLIMIILELFGIALRGGFIENFILVVLALVIAEFTVDPLFKIK